MNRCIAVICLIFFCLFAFSADTGGTDPKEPEPYTDEEFPDYIRDDDMLRAARRSGRVYSMELFELKIHLAFQRTADYGARRSIL